MAHAQIETAGGDYVQREGHTEFDFDEWILQHGLLDIKDKLIEHGLTNNVAISTTSNDFKAFISDPLVLSTKSHVLPPLFSATDKIPNNNNKSHKYVYLQLSP